MNVLVSGLKESCVNVRVKQSLTTIELKNELCTRLSIEPSSFYLTHHGSPLGEADSIDLQSSGSPITLVTAHPILCGGKGGFGSLIRAMGTHINRSTNKGACRDLSGRRMRDVNAEKKIAKWIASEPERKRKKLEEKQKKLERYTNPQKHKFDDPTYMEQIRDVEDNMDSALKQGLEASGSSRGTKRGPNTEDSSGPSKKAKMWVGLDSSELTDSSDSEVEEEDSPPLLLDPGLSGPSSKEGECSQASSGSGVTEEAQEQQQSADSSDQNSSPSSDLSGEQALVTETPPSVDEQHTPPQEQQVQVQVHQEGDTPVVNQDNNEPIIVEDYSSAEELMSVGYDRLKSALQSMGLKCGGTLKERAERLFSTKGKSRNEIDPSLFAKGGKQKRKKK